MHPDITVLPLRGPPSGSVHWWRYWASATDAGGGTRPDESARILIVEDDLLIASQMEAALTDAGFDVAGTASTGKEALHLAVALSPMLVIMDIRLAGDQDGIDTALELFRAHGIRCIFASAHSDQEARRRAAPAAPLGWLLKPYTMASLTTTVRTALDELRSRRD